MKIKKEPLEKAINDSIKDAKCNPGFFAGDTFAIVCEPDHQVQVVITTDKDEFLDEVLEGYAEAADDDTSGQQDLASPAQEDDEIDTTPAPPNRYRKGRQRMQARNDRDIRWQRPRLEGVAQFESVSGRPRI